jgi:hypothetical protein
MAALYQTKAHYSGASLEAKRDRIAIQFADSLRPVAAKSFNIRRRDSRMVSVSKNSGVAVRR